MKAIGVLINDIHLNKENSSLIREIFYQLIKTCEEYDVDKIFCGGDVFTNRSGQPLSCLTTWKDILDVLSNYDIHLYAIPGNHDKTDSDSELSYLDVYKDSRIFHLFSDRGYTIDPLSNCLIGFVPYFNEDEWLNRFNKLNEVVVEIIENSKKVKKSILITHIGIDGVRNNDGSSVTSKISSDLFKNWDKVLVGHYHNASKISNKVIYTGSAYQNNFGETIDDKGFTVLFDDGSTKFVPSEFPKYIKEVIDPNDKDLLMKLIERYEYDKINHIRFVFRGRKVDCEKINVEEIKKKGIDCKFETIETKEAMDISESDSVLSYNKNSISKDFMKFCAENEIRGEKFKFGLNLIKEMNYVES